MNVNSMACAGGGSAEGDLQNCDHGGVEVSAGELRILPNNQLKILLALSQQMGFS